MPAVCPPNHYNTSTTQPLDCMEGWSFRALLGGRGGGGDGDGDGDDISDSGSGVNGKSSDGDGWSKVAAFSQYPRPGMQPGNTSDLPSCNDITVMGYSMRTRDWRYTEWVGFR